MDFTGQNINRVNAIKQLKKGIKNADEVEIYGSIANAFIYMGDCLKDINSTLKHYIDSEEE